MSSQAPYDLIIDDTHEFTVRCHNQILATNQFNRSQNATNLSQCTAVVVLVRERCKCKLNKLICGPNQLTVHFKHTLNRDTAIYSIDYQLFDAVLWLNYKFIMQTISVELNEKCVFEQKHRNEYEIFESKMF